MSSPSTYSYLRRRSFAVIEKASCLIKYLYPDTSDSDDETLFDHVDNNVFDTDNAPETDSVASSSNSVNIDVTPNNQLPHLDEYGVVLEEQSSVRSGKDNQEVVLILMRNHLLGCPALKRSGLFIANAASLNGHLPEGRETAFLNGELNEVVYVSQPEGFVNPDHPSHVYRLKKSLWTQTSSTCVGQMSFFFGLQVSQNLEASLSNNPNMLKENLEKFGFDSCTPIDTPMAERPNLDEDKGGKPINPTRFRGMAGSLMYLSASRPDIVFAVCTAVLKSSGCVFKYEDYGFRRSTKHRCIVTTSKVLLALCCNSVQHSRSKHIDIRHHFIKEQVERKVVELYLCMEDKIPTSLTFFTNALSKERGGINTSTPTAWCQKGRNVADSIAERIERHRLQFKKIAAPFLCGSSKVILWNAEEEMYVPPGIRFMNDHGWSSDWLHLVKWISLNGSYTNEHVVENCKAMFSEEEPKVVRKNDDVLIIEEWVLDDEEEDTSQPKIEKKTGWASIA
ncbi:retrovirus-related pol polyprotein from transposon TNT 1-94 [Tanacetum coccineum]